MSEKQRAFLTIHICVFIWGFTAILGKLISLQALPLVWWRVTLCSAALLLLVSPAARKVPGKNGIFRMLGIGVLIGMHWLCFYGAIKWSNASVAVATMATAPFFSAMAEPFILRRRVIWYEIGLSLLILPAMLLIVGNLDWSMRQGFYLGVLGAALAAVFTAFNKKEIDNYAPEALTMSLYELLGATLMTTIGLIITQPGWQACMPLPLDWLWLLILAYGCTLLTHYLTLRSMRYISAFSTNLATNLEPVYGIGLAILIFKENKNLPQNFYVGVGLVLLLVFSHPLLKKRFE